MVFSISFPKHLEQKIDEYCKRNRMTEADMLCLAIENLLAAENDNSDAPARNASSDIEDK